GASPAVGLTTVGNGRPSSPSNVHRKAREMNRHFARLVTVACGAVMFGLAAPATVYAAGGQTAQLPVSTSCTGSLSVSTDGSTVANATTGLTVDASCSA